MGNGSSAYNQAMAMPSLLCVHGAASGAWVWDSWRKHLGALGWQVNVIDLRGHGRSLPVDLSEVTMEDYLADLESVTPQIAAATGEHPVLFGWSMGGLVALMYAAKHEETPALVLFSPGAPVEVRGKASIEELRKIPSGPFGPEFLGIYPDDREKSFEMLSDLTDEELTSFLTNSRGQQESGFAMRERDRGISIAPGAIRCPALVVYGEAEITPMQEQARRLAIYLAADTVTMPGARHWGIVYHDMAVAEAAPVVDRWLRKSLG
jgi:pimeloyl-ACP methyl ester carboxylesterase